MSRLRVGVIPYSNLFPIFYILQRDFDCSHIEFIEGAPSELNTMLREGEIDLSPSSSVEYLLHKDLYDFIPNHSVSSTGSVGSVLLFSKVPIEKLDERDILVTTQSAVSVQLLRVIATRFYKIKVRLIQSSRPHEGDALAYLLIGDEALRQSMKVNGDCFVYDLGELWHIHTGLPFVFALWIVRIGNINGSKTRLFEWFKGTLEVTKVRALNSLDSIASHCPLAEFMDQRQILEYWNKLDYELTEEHLKGLCLFEREVTIV